MTPSWKTRGFAVAVGIFAVTSLHAQEIDFEVELNNVITQWSADNGVVVTAGGAQTALKAVAVKVEQNAHAVGVDPSEVAKFKMAIEQGGNVSAAPFGMIGKWDTGETALKLKGLDQYAAVTDPLRPKYVFMQLYDLPTLTVLVEPVPPLDFEIEINGRRLREINPNGAYAIEAGEVDLLVTRATRPDCKWKGHLKTGEKRSIKCKM